MSSYAVSHLPDHVLLRDLATLVAQDRTTTAALLAHLAEVDARRLYLPAGYPSMYAYCIGALGLSEQAAFKRIRVGRTAREFPTIFAAVADGRLNLSAVILLTPYLTEQTADELLAAVAHKGKSEIEQLLAERFPRPDLPTRVQTISAPLCTDQLSPGTVCDQEHERQCAPGRVEAPRPRVAPLSPQRFFLQLTIGQSTHDKLRYAQELLSHQVPLGDVAEVLDRSLDALIAKLEKAKFAATPKPRRGQRRATAGKRYIPAAVRRTVWQRDGGRCTFISAAGQRCPARTLLELDHIQPVACGGQATVLGLRLRCRGHNQAESEQTFGAEFMSRKRQAAQQAATARARAAAAAEPAAERDVAPWLRRLGFRAGELRRAAEFCEAMPDEASLEERVRAAIGFLRPRRPAHRRASNPADGGMRVGASPPE